MREKLFLLTAFMLGSWVMLYTDVFNVLIIIGLLVNVRGDFRGFVHNVGRWKYYLCLPLFFSLYLLIHTFFILKSEYRTLKLDYDIFESLLLYFTLIPLYVLSLKSLLSYKLLKQFLFIFCLGVLTFNVVTAFYLLSTSQYSTLSEALSFLYGSRFGGNKEMLGGFVFLEPQALYLSVSAIVSYFFILRREKKTFVYYIAIFILSLFFLSLTVTKAAILAFIGGFVVLSVGYFLSLSWSRRLVFIIIIIVGFLGAGICLPDVYRDRIISAHSEINSVMDGKGAGESIAPRLALWTESSKHITEYGVWGLGVATKPVTHQWFITSDSEIGHLNDTHNSFLQYWILGGILGCVFVLVYFVQPFYYMIKHKQISYLVIAITVVFFIANNTCVLLFLNDSKPLILLMLSMFCLCLEDFVRVERECI